MKKIRMITCLMLSSLLLSACAGRSGQQVISADTQEAEQEINVSETDESETQQTLISETGEEEIQETVSPDIEETESSQVSEAGNHILIAYFTRLDNTEADLDAIVQGGGPYGEIGTSFAEADMDAISSASITVGDDEVRGNTQAVAEMIQEVTGGTLFSIRTMEDYPVDYDELIDLGGEERNANARPELAEQIENIEEYEVIFIGYPNWWHDMPMAVYSFLESYDFSGKTIVPFATSAGGGLSNAIASIQELQPEAEVKENGLHIHMREVADAKERIEAWILELELENES